MYNNNKSYRRNIFFLNVNMNDQLLKYLLITFRTKNFTDKCSMKNFSSLATEDQNL